MNHYHRPKSVSEPTNPQVDLDSTAYFAFYYPQVILDTYYQSSTMAPHQPVAGLNYSANPEKGNWTQQYVRSAFPSSHHDVVKRLFSRASKLVQQNNLYPAAYKSHSMPRLALEQKRVEVGRVLRDEFSNIMEIAGHPDFIERLSKGTLTYVGSAGRPAVVREELAETKRTWDYHADLRKLPAPTCFSSASSSFPSAPRLLRRDLSLPARPRNLIGRLRINCLPPRMGTSVLPVKLRTEHLFSAASGVDLQLSDSPLPLSKLDCKRGTSSPTE